MASEARESNEVLPSGAKTTSKSSLDSNSASQPIQNGLPTQINGSVQSPALVGPMSTILDGRKYALGLFTLIFGLALSVIETSITATALVKIGQYFHNPIKATWVVLSYLLSYMGFALIFARLSDGIGRRNTLILSWLLFGGFSTGSGLSRTLNELIGFRVLQGVGGSGLYTMTFVVGNQITPVKFYGLFGASIGITTAIGSVLGPILGGVITQTSTWRWIYLFNGPCALLGLAGCIFALPNSINQGKGTSSFSLRALKSVDYVGGILTLGATTLLVFALQEAGASTFAWNSPAIISTLTISGICWVAFAFWIWWLEHGGEARTGIQPIIPLRILLSRPTGPAIIVILLMGFPLWIAVVNLPQRFQIVYGEKVITAGVHLLPLLCSVALGGGLGGAISNRKNLTAHTAIFASCMILLGSGLLSTISSSHKIDKAVYGYEFILGLGCGLALSSLTMMVNIVSEKRDIAAAQGIVSQARMLGGSIGISVATIVFNRKLVKALSGSLDPKVLHNLEQSLSTLAELSPEQQLQVIDVYSTSFNQQMRICTYVSAFCVLVALATWQRNPASTGAAKERERLALASSDSHNEKQEV